MKPPPPRIRRYRDTDADAVATVFFEAVHEGAKDHYSAAQRRAWAGEAPDPEQWHDRMNQTTAFVAESEGRVVGFMTIDADGLIDFAFVAPSVRGNGIAWQLYRTVEAEARTLGASRLHAAASHLARPFFERQGWRVVKRQDVCRQGVTLTNFLMESDL